MTMTPWNLPHVLGQNFKIWSMTPGPRSNGQKSVVTLPPPNIVVNDFFRTVIFYRNSTRPVLRVSRAIGPILI